MKKSTMKSLVAFLNGETVANIAEIKAELEAELSKNEAKTRAKEDLYSAAKEIVFTHLSYDKPQTVKEIFAACADELPDDFTNAKLQYALCRYWTDNVKSFDNGKNPKTYVKI